ncbi:DUF2156 domain-containing protein [Pseudooceanicola antarcticus]|uniref:DUF2156 domain-containing protein n=2 Tax=Pseudooceanicola antarcticus TaxID=1247613 RepID=A0ABX4MI58_9RHOB|nr:DUF2156 domain-containing protein [Pseudooceanicola antarcticus]
MGSKGKVMTQVLQVPQRGYRRGLRYVAPLVVGIACLWLLRNRLGGLDPQQISQALSEVRAAQWLLAGLATALSFWALGRYDGVIHRHLRTAIPDREAQLSGISAIALAQLLGLGVVTGTLARWRLLPRLGPLRAAQVTAAVSASFLVAWALVTAAACLLLAPQLLPQWLALMALAIFLTLPAIALFVPELKVARLRFRFPSLQAMTAITVFAAIDTCAAAAALWVLLPEAPGFASYLPVFLLALGAGLFAGTPGGIGPFELSLLALLPELAEEELIAAILAFRLVYYLIPGALAAAHVFRPRPAQDPANRAQVPRQVPDLLLEHAPRAESGVARQNGARLLGSASAGGLCVDTPQTLTLLFDPLAGSLAPLLPRLVQAARGSNRMPIVYKCSARQAVEARRAGWHLLHVADEALIDPGAFSLEGPRHRQLRRKLRQAAKAGIEVTRATELPFPEMARLDAEWKRTHGRARGLSTGRYAPSYVQAQRVYGARQHGHLVAFVTFHQNHNQLCLDLMRHGGDLPDGTMHALICAALEDARRLRLPLSLAAMPAAREEEPPLSARLRRLVAQRSGGAGLTRFKESFAPRRQRLYMAAPGRLSLVLGALDLALAMRRPAITADDPLSSAAPLAYGGRDSPRPR